MFSDLPWISYGHHEARLMKGERVMDDNMRFMFMGLPVGIGVVVGAVIGGSFAIGVGIAIGIVVGAAIGAVLRAVNKPES
jgi:F0F1-type ATP synthase membrane subunit c/vacuolar-type H+-ATPase subunit K